MKKVILSKSENCSRVDEYTILHSFNAKPLGKYMKNNNLQSLDLTILAWGYCEITKKDGETFNTLVLVTDDGVYQTGSQTFYDCFLDLQGLLPDVDNTIRVVMYQQSETISYPVPTVV